MNYFKSVVAARYNDLTKSVLQWNKRDPLDKQSAASSK